MTRPLNHFWSHDGRFLTAVAQPFAARVAFVASPVPRGYPIVAFKVYEGPLSSNWLALPADCTRL